MNLALTASESRWIDFIRAEIVGRLEGDDAARARAAAIVAWWSLKEGVLDLPNPLRHNLCSAAGEKQIGDLGVCPSGAWQIGIAGIQGGAVTLAQAEAAARRLYPNASIESVLENAARTAGVTGDLLAQIRSSTGNLRKSWLLRDGAIAFTLQRPFVENGCLRASNSWCFGTWDTARRFASDAARIRAVIAELEAYFAGAPVPGGGGLLALAALAAGGGALFWLWKAGRLAPTIRSLRGGLRSLRPSALVRVR